MPIVIEDGTIVAGANSYQSLVDAQAFLTAIGLTDPAIDDAALIRAYYYVNSFETQYQGSRISADQTGSFPRSGVCINGFPLDSDAIPSQLIQAQAYTAYYEAQLPGVTQPNGNGATITHEEVTGAVAVDYADNGISSNSFNMASVDALLCQLFGNLSGVIRVVRV